MFRTKKVAAIFDFDKTLSPDYMQRVVFDHYKIDGDTFWNECQQWSNTNMELLGSNHSELSYMNMFLEYVKQGRMPGLSNHVLAELGRGIALYPGVAYLLNTLHTMGVEIYVVSSGIRMMLTHLEKRIQTETSNSKFRIQKIYGGDFREDPETGLISNVAAVISPTDKLKAIYEISKGCDTYGFDVSTSIAKRDRRVPLQSMIYVGDGPSDIFAFNLIHDSGGCTVGVFNPDVPAQFEQIERIREDNRLDMVAIADYRNGSTATYWILGKARELLYKSSEEYESRQLILDLKAKKVGHIHPWSATPTTTK
jgi:2-hydroxy-3-keto-5-methylthiopentenyl-1-phosphate phosphatase